MTDAAGATIRAATDVGGTFTDLVYFLTDPDTGTQEVDHRPRPTRRRRTSSRACSNVIAQERRRRSTRSAFMAHGTTRRHQRADRAQGASAPA